MTSRPGTFLWDWRTFVAIAAAGLVALLLVLVVAPSDALHDARRQVKDLEEQVQSDQVAAGRERATLNAKVDALSEQVRSMGGQPVATVAPSSPVRPPSSVSPASPGRSAVTTTPRPSAPVAAPQATTQPPPPSTTTTTSTTVCAVVVLGRCVP